MLPGVSKVEFFLLVVDYGSPLDVVPITPGRSFVDKCRKRRIRDSNNPLSSPHFCSLLACDIWKIVDTVVFIDYCVEMSTKHLKKLMEEKKVEVEKEEEESESEEEVGGTVDSGGDRISKFS